MFRILLITSSVAVLSACSSLAPVRPLTDTETGLTLPGGYDYAGEVAGLEAPERAWWAGFQSESLNALVSEALSANQTLAQGLANLDASRAALKVANASLLPQASGGLSASSDTNRGLDDVSSSARLSASYQLDLFGANAASRRAALASYDAAVFSQRAVELTVQSDVASGWFNLLSAREQLEVAQRNLEISERIFEIVKVRYTAGTISGFDLSSQSAQLANVRARIPQLEAQIASLESALAILLGQVPQGFVAPEADLLSIALPETAPGLPADLMLRRPDLMQAEANLRGANASIDAARAAFFPSIDLGAGVSSALSGALDPVSSISASLSATIFSAGRLEGQLESAKARREAQLAGYRQAILNALRDVDVSLKAIEAGQAREQQLEIAQEAAQEALRAAKIRYEAGTGDLTSLLNAQQTYFDAANAYVTGRLDRLNAAINLYVALGGAY